MPSAKFCRLLAPACCLLLAAYCIQRCLALRFDQDSLSKTINLFDADRRDIALVLPLELSLTILGPDPPDYSRAVDLLLAVIKTRRNFVQKTFHDKASSMGYMVSDSRRVNLDAGKFTLYYYVAFIGTSRMFNLLNRMRELCNRLPPASGNCSEMLQPTSVILYNLLLLNTFRYFPKNTRMLNTMFTDFDVNGTGSVVARSSDAQDVHHLLCKQFLQCGNHICNMSKILIPSAVSNQLKIVFHNSVVLPIRNNNLKAQNIYTGEYLNRTSLELMHVFKHNITQEDFGVYRSWCDKSGHRCAPDSLATLIAIVTLLLANLL